MTVAMQIIVSLIVAFSLAGASAVEVQNTLNGAGFDVSYEEAAQISAVANDPITMYQNAASDAFNAQIETIKDSQTFWQCVEDVYDWKADYDANGGTVSVPTAGDYTNGSIFHTDSGGYWELQIETEPYDDGTNVHYQFVYVDANGNVHNIRGGNAIDTDYRKKDFHIDYGIIINGDGTYTLQVVQTWFNTSKGETVTDVSYYTYDLPEDMTSVSESDNTTDIPINPDGTITLPDGTVVNPNDDGSYTIDGTTYYPSNDMTLDELLQWILDQIEEDDKAYVPEWEKEEEITDTAVDEAIDEAAEGYAGDLSEFILNSRITKVFPFCLPFDFVRGVKLFAVQPVAPVIKIPFKIEAWGLFPGIDEVITIDLGKFDQYFIPMRWVTTIIFICNLIILTPKITKGAS